MVYEDNFVVHGPYFLKGNKGRQLVIVIDKKTGNRRTVSLPKWIMEKHLGHPLDKDLHTVDHFDSNINNNDINNLRLMPRDEHSREDTRRVKLIKFKCSLCDKDFERSPRLVRDKSKKGATGIFCSRSCAGKYNRKVQLKQMDKFPIQPYIESEYFKKKYVNASLLFALANSFELKYNFLNKLS